MSRVIFYYQTFTGLDSILKSNPDITHIHLSSVHFGKEDDGQPYIHLNNDYPENSTFDKVWKDLQIAVNLGIKVILMIGGAGGGYESLFNNYYQLYPQLVQLLRDKKCISGIDLDIEEPVDIDNIRMLINDFKTDFPNHSLSMAPIQSSLEQDYPGMGGFIYKDLYKTHGNYIDYFNTQFYSDFSTEAFNNIVKNGYKPELIVMGSINGSGSIDVVQNLVKQYPNFGGVFSWEYFSTLPTPDVWANAMNTILNSKTYALFSNPCALFSNWFSS